MYQRENESVKKVPFSFNEKDKKHVFLLLIKYMLIRKIKKIIIQNFAKAKVLLCLLRVPPLAKSNQTCITPMFELIPLKEVKRT